MITHIVSWKLKAMDATDRAAAVADIKAALEPLVGVIDGLLDLSVHANIVDAEANWDVGLVAHYSTLADLAAYQVHPEHVKAAAVPREHTVQRVAIDFES